VENAVHYLGEIRWGWLEYGVIQQLRGFLLCKDLALDEVVLLDQGLEVTAVSLSDSQVLLGCLFHIWVLLRGD
jgi:hypothetical protein